MIAINKAEADIIREHIPDVCITRTMKQKSKRRRYFCEETPRTIKFIQDLRDGLYADEKVGDLR